MNSAPMRTLLAERLLLGALHEHDLAEQAEATAERAVCLARLSRELSLSLDEAATRNTVSQVRLPRFGTWCIADIAEEDGSIHRLPVLHPNPSKAALAKQLEQTWSNGGSASPARRDALEPTMLNHLSGEALLQAVHGEASLTVLTEIGFSFLLVVPLVVRAHVHGALIFVSPPGAREFSTEEISLAVDLAARCALALDNARLYRQADALRRAAQQANQSKSEFLRSMSHELRTPLNAIGGFAELIELGIQGPVTDDQLKSVARIKANQEHLLALIAEILNFARLESGRMTYNCAEVALPGVLAAVADMLAVTTRNAGLKIVGPEPDACAMAWADPDRVRQILFNLVTNAVKYGAAENGTITLRCGHCGDTVTASVADDGAGIAAEKLDSIFEPFVQLPAGLKDRREGVGLGLAISRDLARGMGGELAVASAPGRGTRFTLSLPRARGEGPQDAFPPKPREEA